MAGELSDDALKTGDPSAEFRDLALKLFAIRAMLFCHSKRIVSTIFVRSKSFFQPERLQRSNQKGCGCRSLRQFCGADEVIPYPNEH